MATMPSVSSVSTATSSTMTTLSNLMSKFLDNVNAGKFVTDIGPGLALTVPLLMLLAVLTGGHFMPLQQAPHLRTQYRAIYDEIEGALDQLAAKLPEKLKTEFAAKKRSKPRRKKRKMPRSPTARAHRSIPPIRVRPIGIGSIGRPRMLSLPWKKSTPRRKNN